MRYRYFVEVDDQLAELRQEARQLSDAARVKRNALCGDYEAWGRGGNFNGILVAMDEPIPEGWAFYKSRCSIIEGKRACVPASGKAGEVIRRQVAAANFCAFSFYASRTGISATVFDPPRMYEESVGIKNNRVVGKMPVGDETTNQVGTTLAAPPKGMREIKHSEWISIIEEGAPFGEAKAGQS